MARIDFYVLQRVDERSRYTFACKLAEKAYRLENTVYIHTKGPNEAAQLDELLWTFRDGSFVPHCATGSNDGTEASPVLIGSDSIGVEPRDLLINLSDQIPTFADSFPRVAELVTSDENCRRMSRQRFVEYRNHGHSIQTHKL